MGPESLNNPVGQADSRQLPERILRVLALGVDYGEGGGEVGWGGVVVGDDDVDAHFIGEIYLIERADAAVGGNDQADAQSAELFESLNTEPVSFLRSMRNVGSGARPEAGQAVIQQRGCGYTVGVEVTVDCDELALLDGRGDALDGRCDIGEEVGVGEGTLLDGEEFLD